MNWMIDVQVATQHGRKPIRFESGTLRLVAGPNGVGKSSLLHDLSKINFASGVEILPGHRQITFQNDDVDQLGMTVEQVKQNNMGAPDAFSRYRGAFGEVHLKSIIKRASFKENNINFKIAQMVRDNQDHQEFINQNPSIVRTINSVFSVARLEVEISIVDGRLKARRADQVYSIDRLSDGERASLLLICAILVQPIGGVLLIDEPEKHLHRGIVGPLISSALNARHDLCYLIATHDLDLISWLKPKEIIHLRRAHVVDIGAGNPGVPEARLYDFDVLAASDGMPDSSKISILGSKSLVLFVEGEISSDDKLLYGRIYERWTVVPRESWETVVNTVRALRHNSEYSWLSVCGIIDGDGHSVSAQEKYAQDGIYCVAAPTIENLFVSEPILSIMASEHHKLFGGTTAEERLDVVRHSLTSEIERHKAAIVYRRAVWHINRLLSEKKISVKSLLTRTAKITGIDVDDVLRNHFARVEALMDSQEPFEVLAVLPIKNTPFLAVLPRQLVMRISMS